MELPCCPSTGMGIRVLTQGRERQGFEHMIQSEAETIQQSTADARVVDGEINATNTTIIGRGIGQ